MEDEDDKVRGNRCHYGSILIPTTEKNDSKRDISQTFSIASIGGIFTLAASVVFIINEAYRGSLNRYFSPSSLRKVSTDDTGYIPTWTLYRSGYEPLNYFQSDASTFLKYKFMKDYVAVVEPSALMHLYVDGFGGDDDGPSKYYAWEACIGGKQCKEGTLHRDFNTGAILPCDPYGEYDITVTEYEASGKATGVSDSKTAVCIYVRREIRSLTESDLNATMNAMATLWYTTEEGGQALYGENFHNSTYLASAHYFGAGQQDADHIHEGLGFLLQHIKLTNIFELSIQAVDPSISLPYWDFTIDTAEGTSVYDLMIFQENTFGTLTPPGDTYWGWIYSSNSIDDARIPDGRWKDLKSEKNIWYPTMRNGYGYLRAPWNMNPSPYITRFVSEHDFPPCSAYKTWLMKSDLMMFLKYSPGPVHASTHGNIGGSFGCDYLDWMTKAGYLTKSYQKALCSKWGFKMKDLYRQNFLEPKKGCVINSDDVNLSECGFDCVPSRLGGMVAALNDTLSLYFAEDTPVKTWTAIRDFICEGDGYRVFFGDHLESASAADPSFWPIHPTMERAMQAKFMAGGFETMDWYTDYIEDWICGRNECYEPTLGPSKDYYSQCCFGHYRDDGIIDYVSGNKSNAIGLTNQQVIEYTDPTNSDYGMPYIYDSFSYSHCSDDDFDGFLEDLYWGNIVLSDDDDQTFDLDPFSYLDTQFIR